MLRVSLLSSLSLLLLLFCILFSFTYASPLAQLDPKLRAIIEADPELLAELNAMVEAGVFPGSIDNGRLFNYQRLGK